MKKILTQCQRLFLPHVCALCQNHCERALDLCAACEAELPFIENACTLCATPLYDEQDHSVCGACLKEPPHYDRLICLSYYKDHIARMITQLKFYHQLAYANILGTLMAKHLLPDEKPNCIIPIPLHKKRLRQRGFNQALEIAKPIAKRLEIPIDYKSCQRIRHTQPQTEIDAKHRHNNLKNAFSVTRQMPKQVVILDDVFTTGHTVNELSHTLRKAGIEHIEVWCIAKTLLK